jgi:hypothetical protein
MHALRGVLRDYEVSLGQKVNLGKSSVYFGPGCKENLKNTLRSEIGISSGALSERYLGLPTVVDRSKDGCFKYITDRSWIKVNGMKGQGMSKADSEGDLGNICVASCPCLSYELFPINKEIM